MKREEVQGHTKKWWAAKLGVKYALFANLTYEYGFQAAVEMGGVRPPKPIELPKKKYKKRKYFTCKPGMKVMFEGELVEVAEVLVKGNQVKRERSYISAYKINSGMTLRRSMVWPGYEWRR